MILDTRNAKTRVCMKIALIGHPNVGKSALFNQLSGKSAVVSNYPGTTVEVERGHFEWLGTRFEVIDCPGIYSLVPITEEERVSRDILTDTNLFLTLHVIDAKNLERMLPLTLSLIEAGLPVLLVLNMMDEARRLGVEIDLKKLEQAIGVPVAPVVSVTGEGFYELKQKIHAWYQIRQSAPQTCTISSEALKLSGEYNNAVRHKNRSVAIGEEAISQKSGFKDFGWTADRWLIHPFWGWWILAAVLYFGFYQFVGVLGGKTAVDFLENGIFIRWVNPFFTSCFERWMPWPTLRNLFVGEYGMLTLGVRYAVSLILPIVSFFFIAFSVVEDSGYLPRLAMLLDNFFKRLGLSGRAVIPMVLGFGCVTMATLVTRTLPTRRERFIATFLLSLAIPCSAQLGVILALLSLHPKALIAWILSLLVIFLGAGTLLSKMIPGSVPSFYMELPPLRFPRASNIALKTWARLRWYFWEVFPLFLGASVLIWLGQITGVFNHILFALTFPLKAVGLPAEAANAFLFGFFRRDYGAAGLFDLGRQGHLNTEQLYVSCLMLTLFLPCIAQFLINLKERGWKTGIAISSFTLFFSFGAAWAAHQFLSFSGWLR